MVKDLIGVPRPVAAQRNYDDAVRSLNQLQSNSAVLEKIRVERDAKRNDNIPEMLLYLQRVGIQLDDINKLNVIHVTGTKGKGSTCAFSESILRSHGFKTGFYSSPHLIEVRERIRINGKPISAEAFSHYYWQCHELLLEGVGGNSAKLPSYFRFLTVMAFKVFVSEGVDAAIVEVGIGGRYDSTNFVSKPVVCGVTSLGLDHVTILGDTVEKIAWQKGGIFKADAVCITVPDQPGESEQVLRQCAADVGASLQIAPRLDQLCIVDDGVGIVPALSLQGRVQLVNAALAIQLSRSWLDAVANRQQKVAQLSSGRSSHCSPTAGIQLQSKCAALALSTEFLEGLRRCHWPGRNHVVRCGRVTYYLDGAHTVESIEQCVEWFDERVAADSLTMTDSCLRILLFNSTGDRSATTLLEPLVRLGFAAAAFCPNLVSEHGNSADQTNRKLTLDYQLTKTAENRNVWVTLNRLRSSGCGDRPSSDAAASGAADRAPLTAAAPVPLLERSRSARVDGVEATSLSSSSSPALQDRSKSVNCNDGDDDVHASAVMFPCITTALQWIAAGRRRSRSASLQTPALGGASASADAAASAAPESLSARLASAGHVQVLVTGSLHLVGGVLTSLKHELE